MLACVCGLASYFGVEVTELVVEQLCLLRVALRASVDEVLQSTLQTRKASTSLDLKSLSLSTVESSC